MRNILVFLVVTMVSGQLFSQHDFISNKKWGVIDTQISPENQSVISYSFKGDTLINGEEYFKVSESRTNPVVSNEILSFFVRESTSSRVYLYDSHNQIERLLYDFNLQEGDSFDISIDSHVVPFIVTEVDSVQMVNNAYRKRIELLPHEIIYEEDSIYNKVIWVEGIGNLNYFLSNEFQFVYPKRYKLGCVYDIELNEAIYISETSECLLLNTGELEIEIKLYPNPTEDILNIDCNCRIEKVGIYDINGNELGSYFGDTQIRLSELESGVYFIRESVLNFV